MTGIKTGRRQFLSGLIATGLIPSPTWADAGSPVYLSAAAKPDGNYVLCGIGAGFQVHFQIPLPARGHASAAHPVRPEAIAFARRPGTYAIVIDCVSGKPSARLTCPEGRHFYGHGAYSARGDLLFTTENDYDAGRGRVGVWDVQSGYVRIDEFDSGGIGPHDIRRLPGSDILVVANGGIDTHPDTGRTKLNIATMQSNLAYISDGRVVEIAELPEDMDKNSIRHLAIGPKDEVAFGMQWQGDGPVNALVGKHRRGGQMTLMQAPGDMVREMNGYIGSIAYSGDGRKIAATSPRGGRVHLYDASSAHLIRAVEIDDVCGVAQASEGFSVTSGNGDLLNIATRRPRDRSHDSLSWDNHLTRL